jgi:hypothetical protein
MAWYYETEQNRLQQLLQELLSDEESDSPLDNVYLSDEYQPSGSDDSEDFDERPQRKKQRAGENYGAGEPIASTSAAPPSLFSIRDSIERVIQEFRCDSDSASDNEDDINEDNLDWHPVTGMFLDPFQFTELDPGLCDLIKTNFKDSSPYEIYSYFLNDCLLQYISEETNKYAGQLIRKGVSRKARLNDWKDTNSDELRHFFGIIIWMGLTNYPSIESYWSTKKIYRNGISQVMSRNRFQLLLKTIHFSDNEVTTTDRLCKITPLLTKLQELYKSCVVPGEAVCIDETVVPFRGRLLFKQYIPNKRHKFGIKLFKICLDGGYTYDFRVYCGQSKQKETSVAINIVMDLMKDLLGKGRTLCTDNWYTSVTLAHQLLRNKTHLVGTLRRNRKNNPKEVVDEKLETGQTVARESNTGIVVQKWKDKRDVIILSTRHTDEMKTIQRRSSTVLKPCSILDYNKWKTFIDLSDQKKSYTTSLRKGVKWYRKLAIELLVGTSLVNALHIYHSLGNDRISMTLFKENVVEGLTGICATTAPTTQQPTSNNPHHLIDVGRSGRRRCCRCYEKISIECGRAVAMSKTPQSKYKCESCVKHYCLECFFEAHSCKIE